MGWLLFSRIISHFVSFAFAVTFMTWVSLAVGAAITFIVRTDHGLPKTFRGFLRFCFPREIITMRSCRIDALFYVVNRLSTPLFIAPLLFGSIFCATFIYQGLTALFGPHGQDSESTLVWVCVVTVVTLGADFATFYTHYLDHKISVMWEFHKVHHASEFLIPITNKRFHPVQQVFDHVGVALPTGGLIGIFSYVFSMPIYENTIIGIDSYFLVNALSFYHLRHSHINMSYGWLEGWLLSPAQHQLHHSREGRHWDKNFGLFLSVWDRWFGTLLYSEPLGSFRLGLPATEGNRYQSVLQLYTTPFANIWKMIRSRRTQGSAQQSKAVAEPGPMHDSIMTSVLHTRSAGTE
jgi:sterol desaturase/sphingolipid hydroxylase (fatty acid hydroxylase superfamily)